MLRKIIFILSLALVLVLSACGTSSQPATEFTVDASDFAYRPASITVPAGELVTLTLKNTGKVEHDFVVEKIDVTSVAVDDSGSMEHQMHGSEYDLHISAQAGETSILQFTVMEPGTYRVFCSVAGHEEAGMVGEMTVVARQ